MADTAVFCTAALGCGVVSITGLGLSMAASGGMRIVGFATALPQLGIFHRSSLSTILRRRSQASSVVQGRICTLPDLPPNHSSCTALSHITK